MVHVHHGLAMLSLDMTLGTIGAYNCSPVQVNLRATVLSTVSRLQGLTKLCHCPLFTRLFDSLLLTAHVHSKEDISPMNTQNHRYAHVRTNGVQPTTSVTPSTVVSGQTSTRESQILHRCVEEVVNRATSISNKILGRVRRNIKINNLQLKARAYNALIRLIQECSVSIWDPHSNTHASTKTSIVISDGYIRSIHRG